jgi:hypothetical protein
MPATEASIFGAVAPRAGSSGPGSTRPFRSKTETGGGRPDFGSHRPRLYSADLLPALQSVLVSLADIDVAHESEIEAARNSSVEESLRQGLILELQERHRKRREPYVRQLAVLSEHIGSIGS